MWAKCKISSVRFVVDVDSVFHNDVSAQSVSTKAAFLFYVSLDVL